MTDADRLLEKRLQQLFGIAGLYRGLAMFRGWGVYSDWLRPQAIARPQRPFRPTRLVLPPATADRWVIHNIRLGNVLQFPEPIPGATFAADNALAPDFDFGTAPTGMDVALLIEYVGDDPNGERFMATMIGTAIGGNVGDAPRRRDMLSFGGSELIPPRQLLPSHGHVVLVELDDHVWKFSEKSGRLHDVILHLCGHDDAKSEIAMINGEPAFPQRSESGITHYGASDGNTDLPAADSSAANEVAERLQTPIMVSLHVATVPPRLVLFGIDDATSRVVFEVGNGALVRSLPSSMFAGKLDVAGYTPWWWDAFQAWNEDLLAKVERK